MDNRLYGTRDPNTQDLTVWHGKCPSCEVDHKFSPRGDMAILSGEKAFRCYFGSCMKRSTVLRIVSGLLTDISRPPIFDVQAPRVLIHDKCEAVDIATFILEKCIPIGTDFGQGERDTMFSGIANSGRVSIHITPDDDHEQYPNNLGVDFQL